MTKTSKVAITVAVLIAGGLASIGFEDGWPFLVAGAACLWIWGA